MEERGRLKSHHFLDTQLNILEDWENYSPS